MVGQHLISLMGVFEGEFPVRCLNSRLPRLDLLMRFFKADGLRGARLKGAAGEGAQAQSLAAQISARDVCVLGSASDRITIAAIRWLLGWAHVPRALAAAVLRNLGTRSRPLRALAAPVSYEEAALGRANCRGLSPSA